MNPEKFVKSQAADWPRSPATHQNWDPLNGSFLGLPAQTLLPFPLCVSEPTFLFRAKLALTWEPALPTLSFQFPRNLVGFEKNKRGNKNQIYASRIKTYLNDNGRLEKRRGGIKIPVRILRLVLRLEFKASAFLPARSLQPLPYASVHRCYDWDITCYDCSFPNSIMGQVGFREDCREWCPRLLVSLLATDYQTQMMFGGVLQDRGWGAGGCGDGGVLVLGVCWVYSGSGLFFFLFQKGVRLVCWFKVTITVCSVWMKLLALSGINRNLYIVSLIISQKRTIGFLFVDNEQLHFDK